MSAVAATKIIAHRGASAHAPENTLRAFRLAWECEADGIEGDFRLTRDGHIICLHDATTKRTGDCDLRADESTLRELRRVDVGLWKGPHWRGERIATMEEIVEILPEGKLFFLEVKCGPEIVTPLKAIVETTPRLTEQLSVISFDARVIAAMRTELPLVQANWLTEFQYDEQEARWHPTGEEVASVLEELNTNGVGVQANLAVVNEAFVAPLHARDIALHVWTVDDFESAARFTALGFRSITTNRPGELRAQASQR